MFPPPHHVSRASSLVGWQTLVPSCQFNEELTFYLDPGMLERQCLWEKHAISQLVCHPFNGRIKQACRCRSHSSCRVRGEYYCATCASFYSVSTSSGSMWSTLCVASGCPSLNHSIIANYSIPPPPTSPEKNNKKKARYGHHPSLGKPNFIITLLSSTHHLP